MATAPLLLKGLWMRPLVQRLLGVTHHCLSPEGGSPIKANPTASTTKLSTSLHFAPHSNQSLHGAWGFVKWEKGKNNHAQDMGARRAEKP